MLLLQFHLDWIFHPTRNEHPMPTCQSISPSKGLWCCTCLIPSTNPQNKSFHILPWAIASHQNRECRISYVCFPHAILPIRLFVLHQQIPCLMLRRLYVDPAYLSHHNWPCWNLPIWHQYLLLPLPF